MAAAQERNYQQELQEIDRLAFRDAEALHLTYVEANKAKNLCKNRYDDVLPYDSTRVVLENGENGDYINASWKHDGDDFPANFVASQAPLPGTVNDFWKMIWQCNVKIILMLTKLRDKNEEKSAQYWPQEPLQTEQYGPICVRFVEEHQKNQVAVERTFEVRHITHESDAVRTVKQLHFISWPDFGVPDILEFGELLTHFNHLRENQRTVTGKVLVHCSSGIGRTGTFMTVQRILQKMSANNSEVDVTAIILELRKTRAQMVETHKQLKFIYDFIVHIQKQSA